MTEAEWLACDDPQRMLEFLRGKVSRRKLRLFAAACCRQVAHMLIPEAQAGIDLAERVAEGEAGPEERKQGREKAHHVGWHEDDEYRHRRGPAKAAVSHALARKADEAATNVLFQLDWPVSEQTAVARDIFGNSFRPATPHSAPSRVHATLAEAAYEQRHLPSGVLDVARLAVLSDALEEAGCTDADILAHLRSPGPHVRGCWALDLVLGKA